ncbi:hypothetical protein M0R45_021978 [Rubus argutus]|uniref:Uncharacterized protein n=1 Tax=Rubus argutus TaxID=59490 RepID=A0AAW1XE88_RUBAR
MASILLALVITCLGFQLVLTKCTNTSSCTHYFAGYNAATFYHTNCTGHNTTSCECSSYPTHINTTPKVAPSTSPTVPPPKFHQHNTKSSPVSTPSQPPALPPPPAASTPPLPPPQLAPQVSPTPAPVKKSPAPAPAKVSPVPSPITSNHQYQRQHQFRKYQHQLQL